VTSGSYFAPVFEIVPEAFALHIARCDQGLCLDVSEELIVDGGSFMTQGWVAEARFMPFDLIPVHDGPSHRSSDLAAVGFLSLYGSVVKEGPEACHLRDYWPSLDEVEHRDFLCIPQVDLVGLP